MMKKQLVALSLLMGCGLFAEEGTQEMTQQRKCCPSCNCCPCTCKPCEPKKCIDCECYTPQYYDLDCDWGFTIFADFLYWYARETNIPYAHEFTLKPHAPVQVLQPLPANAFAPVSTKHLKTKWEPGLRVGFAWNTDCDGWDFTFHWTYLDSKKNNSSSTNDVFFQNPGINQVGFLNPWINQSFNGDTATPFARAWTKVSASWNLIYNAVDWELGRKYWLSRCFTLRPYTGVRGAWTKTRFTTCSTITEATDDTVPVTSFISFKDRFKNKYWGAGILGGLQPNWYFCRSDCGSFVIYGNFEGALIWGELDLKKRERYTSEIIDPFTGIFPISYNNTSKSSFFQMTGILDLGIGFRWERYWCCYRYRSALDLGWEHHIWFDQNHRIKTVDNFGDAGPDGLTGYKTIDEATGNLMFGGLIVRLTLDF